MVCGRREFKFNPRAPSDIRFIENRQSEASVFLAARFGLYANEESYDTLKRYFGATPVLYDASFKGQLGGGRFTFPIALSGYACSQLRQRMRSHAYILLNPHNVFDVVDFWNLRAAGMRLFPLTLEDYKEFETARRESLASTPFTR